MDDEKVGNIPGKYSLGGVGLGATYYFMPINIFISGSVGLSVLRVEIGSLIGIPLKFETEAGFGASLLAGKEWWLFDNWALGFAGQLIYSVVPSDAKDTHRSIVIGIVASLTYN